MGLLSDCAECRKIWADYSVATTEHIRLKGKLALASLTHDGEAVRALTRAVAEAHDRRNSLRAELLRHRRETHSVAGAAEA